VLIDTGKLMPTLAATLAKHGTTRDAFNGWLRGHQLSTGFDTKQGATRDLTRENAIEIGFMAALARAGVEMNYRGVVAMAWLRMLREGTLPAMAALDRGRPQRPTYIQLGETVEGLFLRLAIFKSGFVDGDDEHTHRPAKPTEVVLINLAEIVNRAEQLFTTGETV
jgi:hypothetical protein